MPKKRTATFYVEEDGTLYPKQKAKWLREQIQLFSDGRIQITIERPTRSLSQNSYYWGVVIGRAVKGLHEVGVSSLHMMGPTGELVEIPLTKDALHEWMKHKYIPVVAPGKKISTTVLDETEMSDYIECIRQDEDILQAGIYIPEPGEEVPA